MKQHISVEDLEMLTEEGKSKLREWCKTCRSLQDEIFEGGYDPDSMNLSIGQLIEFLDEHDGNVVESIEQYKNIYWSVVISNKYSASDTKWLNKDGEEVFSKMFHSNELCDALWDACVEVLNEKTK